MALLFKSDMDRYEAWRDSLRAAVPGLDVRKWPEVGDAGEIDFALVWAPPPGMLKGLPNLKAIFSLGAGVDHVLRDPELPAGVPLTRIVDARMTMRMTEYVVLHVLRHHRLMPQLLAQQRRKQWHELIPPAADQRTVGIMGLGVLGGDAAAKLRQLGFRLRGWARSRKTLDGVETFHGPDGLKPFLGGCEILVCLLPLTPETTDILNAETLGALPAGACLVNAARGRHLVEEALLAALDSGHLAGATLDVFRREPLPPEHPFWEHPKVTITPHVASITDPASVTAQVAENIRRARAGEPLLNVVDTAAGY